MKMRIVLATHNTDKSSEMTAIFGELPIQLLSLKERSRALVSNFDPSSLFHWKHSTPFNKLKNDLSPALGLALGKI